MLPKWLASFICASHCVLVVACGGTTSGNVGDDRLFLPEGLANTSLDGVQPLNLVAFTLVQGAAGPEFYAAVRNDGPSPVCNAGMITFFNDKAGQEMTSVATGLQARQFYRFEDSVVRCIDSGELAMAAATNLPGELSIEKLGSLTHTLPAFGLEPLAPLPGFMVSGVATVPAGTGARYSGKFTNEMTVAVSAPSVWIFPVNRVGRPLGAATSAATLDVPSGGSWTFQTDSVSDPGAGFAAFPAATIPN